MTINRYKRSLMRADSREVRLTQAYLFIAVGLPCILILSPSISPAQPVSARAPLQPQVTVPRVSSMGSSGIAGSRATSAFITNPAGMVLDSSYVVDANYFRTQTEENWLSLSVTDSQTHQGRFALGLGYQTKVISGDFTSHDAQIGLAMPIFQLGSRPVFGGVTGHYLYDDLSQDDLFDIDLGLMVPLGKVVSIGVVGDRLLEANERRWGAGLGFTTHSMSAHLDLKHSFETESSDLNIGVEGLLSSSFVARGGYIHRFTPQGGESQAMTLGLAILGLGTGRGRVNVSYVKSLIDDEYLFGAGFSTYLDTRIR